MSVMYEVSKKLARPRLTRLGHTYLYAQLHRRHRWTDHGPRPAQAKNMTLDEKHKGLEVWLSDASP
jgi:hypothetical protein